MAKKAAVNEPVAAPSRAKPSSLVDTGVTYCGDNLEFLSNRSHA